VCTIEGHKYDGIQTFLGFKISTSIKIPERALVRNRFELLRKSRSDWLFKSSGEKTFGRPNIPPKIL
jgi:hypothetical protein